MRPSHALSLLVPFVVLAAAAQDSPALQLIARLKSHPQLSKLEYVERGDLQGLALAFHKPGHDYSRGFESKLAEQRAPWIARMSQIFQTEYADRFRLTRRSDRPTPSLVCLWTAKDYEPYLTSLADPNAFSPMAHYDAGLGAVITFESGAPTLAPHWRRQPELAQIVRGEFDAYAARPDVRLPHWLAEGLSSYLSVHQGSEVSELDKHPLDPRSVQRVVDVMHDLGNRNATLLPLSLACGANSYAEHRAALIKKVGPAAEKLIKAKDMAEIVHAHAWTFVHFLNEAENGKYRFALGAYLKSALQGDGSFAAFEKAFPGVVVASLEGAYFTWVFEQCAALYPKKKIDPLALKGLGASAPMPSAAPGEAGSFDARELALGDEDHEARHAAILQDARAGRFEAAIVKLEELRASPKIGEWAARADREIDRCKKFVAMRDAHLAQLAANGEKLTFVHEGKKVTTKVKSIADGKLFLDENKAKLADLPVAALDPVELAKSFAKAVTDTPDGWARWYPAALAGDAKAIKSIKGAGPAAELKADAESWYPGALKLGAAVVMLRMLSERGEPFDPEAAKVCLESIQKVRSEFGELEPIQKRADAMHALAKLSLKRLWSADKLAEATAAKVETLPDQRVRMTYEFENKAEGADFRADHVYFGVWRQNLTDRTVPEKPSFAVEAGALRTNGAACWRLPWTFSEPVLVKYEIALDGLDEDPARTPLFAWAVCDDGKENFAWCQGFGSLYANDARTNFVKSDSRKDNFEIQSGVDYRIELELSGGKMTTRENGEMVKEASGLPHRAGGMFFFVHSDPFVLLEKLVIEGKPDMASIEQAWIERRLTEMKL